MLNESEEDRISTERTIKALARTCLARVEGTYPGIDHGKVAAALMEMHGLSPDKFDFLGTVDRVMDIKGTLNSVSIDDNANKSSRNVQASIQESIAPVRKAIGFDYYYRKVRQSYGEDEARRLFGKVLDYTLGLADETSILVEYCWSWNASLYVVSGKDFGTYRSLPPENVGEYVGGVCEIIHEFASNLAGALAIGTFFFDIAHILLYKERIDFRELRSSQYLRNQLKSEFRQFILSVNNVSRNGIESPFTNVSLFDRPKVRKMLEELDWYFPFDQLPINSPSSVDDERKQDYYLDFLCEYVNELQDLYLDVFDKGDQMNGGIPYTFPVTTMNISKSEGDGKSIVDAEFVRDICNREIYRYNIFASKGSKIASCCFKGSQAVNLKIGGKWEETSLERAYFLTHHDDGEETGKVVVGSDGREVAASVVRIPYSKPFVAILFEDGSRFITTDNHRNAYPVSESWYADKESLEVVAGDVLFTGRGKPGLKVTSVNYNIPNGDKYAYCLEVADPDATHFTMPNGVLTHNCRLINDMEMMDLASQSNSFGAGGSVSLGCYDDHTEVLTDHGWKFFKDLDKSEKVLTFNKDTEDMEWQHPTDYVSGQYRGEMHHYKTMNLDFLVTPNHNMVVSTAKNKKQRAYRSDEIVRTAKLKRTFRPVATTSDESIAVGGSVFDRTSFYRFLGAYLGDGLIYHDSSEAKYRAYEISFLVKKERKIGFIKKVLESLGVNYAVHSSDGRKNIHFYSKDIWQMLVSLGKTKEKRIPSEILMNGNADDLEALFDGLVSTDGSRSDKMGTWFYTSSRNLADDFQQLCVMLGKSFHSRVRSNRKITFPDGRVVASGDCYEISVIERMKNVEIAKHMSVEYYDGMVYCLTVPNHTMFVRRNGTVMMCGNSDRVITSNTLRIAIQAETKDDFYRMVAENMEDSAKLLKAHKELMKDLEQRGVQPFVTAGWIDLDRMFSTFGIIGTYETAELFKQKFGCPEDFEMEQDLLRFINTQMEEVCKKYGIIGNIEQIPGESFAIRLMKADHMLFPDCEYIRDRQLQSNQLVPLWLDCPIWDRMEKDGRLNRLITGGGIVHLTIGERTTPSQSAKLIKFAVQSGCEHFALNPIISRCPDGHVSFGTDVCPQCGKPISDHYTRIIGYFRPVERSWGPRAVVDFPYRVRVDKSLKNMPKDI